VGNEKGGSGKTTVAVHLAVGLARHGMRVAAVDLDIRQRSCARYFENRAAWCAREGVTLAMPEILAFATSNRDWEDERAQDESKRLAQLLAEKSREYDCIVIDTPGSDTDLSRQAHAAAETLITPMNDSFVDFDVLARIDPVDFSVQRPSVYSEFVWDCRKARLQARKPALDWVVLRNRVSATEARNKRRIAGTLEALSRRIGFRIAPAFGDRVIFRELFPWGLTVLDLPQARLDVSLSMSHVAGKQEVRQLLQSLSFWNAGALTE
jgi:chromosome partitioning protein